MVRFFFYARLNRLIRRGKKDVGYLMRALRLITVTTSLLTTMALADGAIVLRLDPPVSSMEVGTTATIAVILDQANAVRAFEFHLAVTPGILTDVTGSPGELFSESPCEIWQHFSDAEGEWRGYAITVGADCWCVGPGELFRITFTKAESGTSLIEPVEVYLFDEAGDNIDGVTLTSGRIVVVPESPVTGMLYQNRPNPFNARTRIDFDLEDASSVNLTICDISGRLVATLLSNRLMTAGRHSVDWHGRTVSGTRVASGVYICRLRFGSNHLVRTMVLAN